MGKSQDLYKRAKKIIPGGTQLLSKRPEMFLPDEWPSYYKKAKGCRVWDLDGNEYRDMSYMAIGACVLGYADPDVDRAVKEAIDSGSATTLNAPEEEYLAEKLIELHPWAGMVRYTRSGGEAMVVAVRIARAKSGKDKILFCGYHGWHDWYLAANLADDKALDGQLLSGLSPRGVPRGLTGTAFPFFYNDTKGFLELIEKHRGEIAAVVMEPIRNIEPTQEFIDTIQRTTKKENITLVVDDITAAWRLNLGGAHLVYGIEPDIAVFGKGISNGFPMSAIIGKVEVMSKAQDSFISSTNWTEKIGPVAALATIKKYETHNVQEHLIKVGKRVQDGWAGLAKKHNLDVHIDGIYPLGHFTFKYEKPLVLKTLYTQLMLERGFLATTAYYASFAHKEEDIEMYLKATDESFAEISKVLKEKNIESFLKGPVCHAGFSRLT